MRVTALIVLRCARDKRGTLRELRWERCIQFA